MKKILVVDNHPVMLKFMSNILKKEGHQVLTAEDGLSALEILKTYIPDVMFIDLVMPNIDGRKLCRIIRSKPNLKDAYLIIISGTAAEEDLKFTEFGANACIAKGPFNKMSKHVLEALDQSTSNSFRKKVIGLEDIYPREVIKELLSAQRHFEAILRNMSEGILELTLEGKIVYANPKATLLTCIPEEELLGSNFYDLFDETDRERIRPLLKVIDDIPQAITEDSPVTLNDKLISLNVLLAKEKEYSKSIVVVILDDVTKRKHLEAQIQHAQRMESVGTLAAGIAHNFNNLLMGIQGNASLVLLQTDSNHSNSGRLENIEKLVESGAKLTAQLLGYAREGRYEVKPLSLNQLVKDIFDTFGAAKKDMRIHHELADDLFGIMSDQDQIEQVLLNLYLNAADAMPGGGDLFLKTMNISNEDIKGKPYKPKPGNYVLLTVKDTGVGMDKKTMDRIFDPFFTTKGVGKGTGLGLASSYGIIKGHGGYIDVHSERDYGTTFSIYLPAAGKEVKEERKFFDVPLKGSGTILLVDDEDMILDVGEHMLKRLGYEVLLARGGQDALDLYKKHQDIIDTVLLDIVMPGMGGGETYDRLKQINSKVKVLLSSGYSIEGEAKEILKRGCHGFIQKPFNLEELSNKIREVLDKK